jgi:uncharacterized integral membrane protein
MPWRLLSFLLVLALFVAFTALNVDHVADISFGFFAFERVPVFLSLFLSFLLGAIVMIPALMAGAFRRRKKAVLEGKKRHGRADILSGDTIVVRGDRTIRTEDLTLQADRDETTASSGKKQSSRKGPS